MSSGRSIRADIDVEAHAKVILWGKHVGEAVQYGNGRIGFRYSGEFLNSGFSISPKHLALESRVFEFPELRNMQAFMGLPGVLADSLPDAFGNLIIRNYFESRGEPEKALSPVQRLLYIGNRAMGALEYAPRMQRKTREEERALEIMELVESARKLIEGDTSEAIHEIMKVGGSAGGARAKALILWDRKRQRVRSGFALPRAGDEAWMVKFDGVSSANELDHNAKPFNRIEYTYALIAKKVGIEMAEVAYLEGEGGLFHFMTKRFDRNDDTKVHMHSLGGMTHIDYNRPQAYSYEAWFRLILELGLGYPALEQAYRRMVFNLVGRNQDDHVKNISFLLRGGNANWELAPAYDLTFAVGNGYTVRHQMTLDGRSDAFTRKQVVEIGKRFDVKRPEQILDETVENFSVWHVLAKELGVGSDVIQTVSGLHRNFA